MIRVLAAGQADVCGARKYAKYCGVRSFVRFRHAVLFRQASVGVALVSDQADTVCGASQDAETECGDVRNAARTG